MSLMKNFWKGYSFRSNEELGNCCAEEQSKCLNGQVVNGYYFVVPGSCCSTSTESAGCYWAGNSYGCCLQVAPPSYCYSVHYPMAANSGILEKYIPGLNVDGYIQVKYKTENYAPGLHYSGFGRLDSGYSGLVRNTDTAAEAAQ